MFRKHSNYIPSLDCELVINLQDLLLSSLKTSVFDLFCSFAQVSSNCQSSIVFLNQCQQSITAEISANRSEGYVRIQLTVLYLHISEMKNQYMWCVL